jgi:hypothetical protein
VIGEWSRKGDGLRKPNLWYIVMTKRSWQEKDKGTKQKFFARRVWRREPSALFSGIGCSTEVWHQPLCIRAENWIHHSLANALPMITHSMSCFNIRYLLRKIHFSHQKSCMTLSLNVRQNVPKVNLSISHAQRTFDPGHLQRTYWCIWRGCSHLLDRNQVSMSEAIHLYSC